jgi:hypothetical protein
MKRTSHCLHSGYKDNPIEIAFVNHASIVFRSDDISLMTGRWYKLVLASEDFEKGSIK